jgi:hypothetical protein
VGRIALAAFVVAGLFLPAGLAAAAPSWTAKGAITKLSPGAITVHGTSCRITSMSPARGTLRLYYVGAEAKIACVRGVLRAIDVLEPLAPITSSAPPVRVATLTAIANSSVALSHTAGSTFTVDVLAGRFAVTTLSDSSITAGAGSIGVTCTVGNGSPDIGGLQVGDGLTRMECRNGILTALVRA